MYHAKHMRKRERKKTVERIASWALCACLLLSSLCVAGGYDWMAVDALAASDGLEDYTIDTVSPSHVKFDLFDYDAKKDNFQHGIGAGHPLTFYGTSDRGEWNCWTGNEQMTPTYKRGPYPGIVQNLLRDGYPALDLSPEKLEKDIKEGQKFITDNGYQEKVYESLAYLFDPDVEQNGRTAYKNVQGLLKYDENGSYVYDCHENFASYHAEPGIGANGESSDGHFDVYNNFGILDRLSGSGQFFPFAPIKNIFENENGIYQTDEKGLLKPKVVNRDEAPWLNHLFGMTMETEFFQPKGGKLNEATNMSFTFSGDDDVWIFIDDVLVSDLGGIHDESFTTIDFATGMVYTGRTPVESRDEKGYSYIPTAEELTAGENDPDGDRIWHWVDRVGDVLEHRIGNYETFKDEHAIQASNLKEIFEKAKLPDGTSAADHQSWGDGTTMNDLTFDEDTVHTLKLFYMERGAGASNLVMEFNMLAVPASGITKTDQNGNPVAGAEFTLWPAQVDGEGKPVEQNGRYIADKSKNPICTAATNANGHLTFVSDQRKIISFQELANNGQFYYVLEETHIPPGYRSNGDISLYYSMPDGKTTARGLLLSHNYWLTGVYTQAKLHVTLPETLYEYRVSGNQPAAGAPIVPEEADAKEYLDDGIIFAVPIKRADMGDSLHDEDNWYAAYGTANTGWSLMTKPISDKQSVLDAAKKLTARMAETGQSDTILAQRDINQRFFLEVTNTPGDVKQSYPYLWGTDDEDSSRYSVAFFFAPNAKTLDDIEDANQIQHISAVGMETDSSDDDFKYEYSSQFYISNTLNQLHVQKNDYHGNRIGGVEFSLYQTYSTWDRDGDGDLYVVATDPAHLGMYRNTFIVNEDGTLKKREKILNTTPYDKGNTTQEGGTGTGGLDIDGEIVFPTAFDAYMRQEQPLSYRTDETDTSTYLEQGEYVLYETGTKDGYTLNETAVPVTVNQTGVFADAGEKNDGVRVGKYTGWILNSMVQFASEGAFDETLTFMNSTLQVIKDDGTLAAPEEGEITWMNKYSNENNRYIFLADKVGHYVTAGRNLFQYTDVGIPHLTLRQNTDVTAYAIRLDGKYESYNGPVTVNKRNQDGSIYSLEGLATNGTIAYWLRKDTTAEGEQTLDSIEIKGTKLTEGTDYHIYEPNVTDLSGEIYSDLSALFSVETLVQVYDQNIGSLQVTKKTEQVAQGSEADKELFYYRVYNVYEQATEVVLAKLDAQGKVKYGANGQPVIKTDFNGVLNVRLREQTDGAEKQETITNMAVEFKNGRGLLYLEPRYEVEHVYIPENKDHLAYNCIGLVKAKITLEDNAVSGEAEVSGRNVSFPDQSVSNEQVLFEHSVGTLYHNPNYFVTEVKIGNQKYYRDPEAGQKGLDVTSRYNYATVADIVNLENSRDVGVTFREADGSLSPPDRITVRGENGGNTDVTVYRTADGTYRLSYERTSNTVEKAVVGQFALYAGQTITIDDLPGGATYYVQEFAVDQAGKADSDKLEDDWNTVVEIIDGNQGDEVWQEYRNARGIIRTNDTQKLRFTNSGRVGRLTVSKTVTGEQADDQDRNTAFNFTIAMKKADGTPLTGAYPYTGNAIEGVEAPQAGTLTLNEKGEAAFALKHGQSITIDDIPKDAVCTVTETAQAGYSTAVAVDNDEAKLSHQAEVKVIEEKIVRMDFTNIRQKTFTFTKVAAEDTDTPLTGAEFKLYKLTCTNQEHDHSGVLDPNNPGSCWKLVDTKGSDPDVSFADLEVNTEYRLVETKAPDGRVLPAGQWKITTDETGGITVTDVENGTQKPPAFVIQQNGDWLLPNMRPVDVPLSGGFGAMPYLIGGGLLMLLAGVLILIKKLYGKRAASNKE